MEPPGPPPSYALAFRVLPNPPFPKKGEGAYVSMLHAKYWGVSIDHDESEWVGVHGQLPENDGSEVVRGCFTLNLPNNGCMLSKLWVRKDYLRIYDNCRSHCDHVWDKRLLPPVAIITGQPGIGKRQWIYYAIRRRLGEAKPFLWYDSKRWYLFVEDGVFECPGTLNPTSFVPYMWAFVETNGPPANIPPEIGVGRSNIFTILPTPPRREQWKPLLTNRCSIFLIMNPWTWEELCNAADIHMLTEAERTQAKEVFLEYGPTPRLCINFVRKPSSLDTFRNVRTGAIANLKLDTLITFVLTGEDLDVDNMGYSNYIFLTKRKNVDDLLEFTIEPISLSVKRLLKRQLMNQEKKERLQAYLRSARVHDLGIITGIVFESLVQLQLQEEVALNLVPMVKASALRSRGNAKRETQSSSPADDAANPPLWIQFKPTDTVEYDGSTLSGFQTGVFYVQTSSNELAFDSFILVDQVLYIFQFSIAALHEINEGMTKLLSRPTLEAKLRGVEWRLVFVIPSGSKMDFPESNAATLKEFLDRARLFTAEIDIRQAGQSRGGDGNPNPNVPIQPRPRQTCSSTRQSGEKRKAQVDSPINEATSSKARQPARRRKVRK